MSDREACIAQTPMRQPENLLRAIFDCSPEAMLIADDRGVYVDANAAACELFGLAHAELVGRKIFEFAAPGHRSEPQFERFLGLGRMRGQFPLQRIDGTRRTLEYTAVANVTPGLHLAALRDVTDQLAATEALRRSEARFRALSEKSADGMTIISEEGTILYLGNSVSNILGFAPEAMIGRNFGEFILPEDRARAGASHDALVARGGDTFIEFRVRHADGSVRWVEASGKNLLNDPDVGGLVGNFRDITRRKHLEVAARDASEERERLIASLEFERSRLGTLLAKAPAFIAVLRGKDHVFELLNDACYELIGRRDVLGKPISEALPEVASQGMLALLDRVIETGEPYFARSVSILLSRRPDLGPEQRYVDLLYQPLIEANGERRGVFVHGVDVTDAAVAQQRVRAQFHVVPAPTYVWQHVAREGRSEFILVDFNQAALALSGADLSSQLGKSASTFFVDAPIGLEELETCLKEGTPSQREINWTLRLSGEVRRLSITYAPAPPDLVIIHTEDLTERLKLEHQLRQAQKMEAIGRLAGGVAHDFNNLLSVILSYSEFMIGSLRAGDPLRDDVEQIQIAGQRATDLTRQLLAFSRQQVLEPRIIDLNEVVSSMKPMLVRLLGEDVELTVLASQPVGRVLADPGQIEQVLMNLALNARDAMVQGGKLTVETSNVRVDAGAIGKPQNVAPGDFVLLAISDTGVGMDEATLARIFEPFFTTKEHGKGTGLGLATVFGIVHQSGGYVGVYSEIDHGSTFKIYLPQTDRIAPVSAHPSRGPAPRTGSETILLVEDEDQVRTVACAILRRHGYVVLETCNGGEAFLVALDYKGEIDLLLTDVIMPRVSGRKLAEQLAAQRPGMKVLFASGYTDDVVIRHGVLDAGVAFLQKPFTPQALLAKVREVLDEGERGLRYDGSGAVG